MTATTYGFWMAFLVFVSLLWLAEWAYRRFVRPSAVSDQPRALGEVNAAGQIREPGRATVAPSAFRPMATENRVDTASPGADGPAPTRCPVGHSLTGLVNRIRIETLQGEAYCGPCARWYRREECR